MTAGVAHLVGLLHRQDARRVRTLFELRLDELGAGAAASPARVTFVESFAVPASEPGVFALASTN